MAPEKKVSKALDNSIECGIILVAGQGARRMIRASPCQGVCPAGPRGHAGRGPQKNASPPAGELGAGRMCAPQRAQGGRGGKVSDSEPDWREPSRIARSGRVEVSDSEPEWRKPSRIGQAGGVEVSHCELSVRQNGRRPECPTRPIRGGWASGQRTSLTPLGRKGRVRALCTTAERLVVPRVLLASRILLFRRHSHAAISASCSIAAC